MIFTLLSLVVLSLFAIIHFNLSSIERVSLNNDKLNLSKNEELKDIINVALFGTDNRNPNSKSRSDSVMVLSINPQSKKIKLTSIMRDTLVNIPGKGLDKLTHAHAYGGPELAISTLNSNFDLNISQYASVDFFSLAKIVDILGGFEVTVSNTEAKAMNKAINELNRIEGLSYGTDYTTGSTEPQLLNGRQAVSYARIRKVGNGDYERTQRQRRLLEYCINKMQDLDLTSVLALTKEIAPLVSTSLSTSDIINLGTKIFSLGKLEIEQLRIPQDGTFAATRYNSMFVLEPNLDQNKVILHNFIKDIQPTD